MPVNVDVMGMVSTQRKKFEKQNQRSHLCKASSREETPGQDKLHKPKLESIMKLIRCIHQLLTGNFGGQFSCCKFYLFICHTKSILRSRNRQRHHDGNSLMEENCSMLSFAVILVFYSFLLFLPQMKKCNGEEDRLPSQH